MNLKEFISSITLVDVMKLFCLLYFTVFVPFDIYIHSKQIDKLEKRIQVLEEKFSYIQQYI